MRHEETWFVLLILVLILLAFLRWAFIPRRKLSGNRVRVTRIRIRLRLHPGRGHATAFELWFRWVGSRRSAAAGGRGEGCRSLSG